MLARLERYLIRRALRRRQQAAPRRSPLTLVPPGAIAYDRQVQRWLTHAELEQRGHAAVAARWKGPRP